jgi:hypothetical protein
MVLVRILRDNDGQPGGALTPIGQATFAVIPTAGMEIDAPGAGVATLRVQRVILLPNPLPNGPVAAVVVV